MRRALANNLAEQLREVCLIRKATLGRNLDDGLRG